MTLKIKPTASEMSLPMLIMTPMDVKRLQRELTVLNDYLHQQALRTPGLPMARMPRTSRLLEELAAVNKLNLIDQASRRQLSVFLADIAARAPIIHISFAVDPTSAFLLKIMAWFRQSIHPLILMRVGLQPGIAAGCVIRTTNRYFDLSLHKTLEEKRNLLRDMLAEAKEPSQLQPNGTILLPDEATA